MKTPMKATLLAAVAALLLSACGQQAQSEAESAPAEKSVASGNIKFAYVNIDSLTSQYKRYQDASDEFQRKQDNAQATIQAKGKSFASQVQEFQRKVQSNAITQEQYNNEQARLAKLQQDLEDLQTRLSSSLQEEYATKLQELTDTIKNFMAVYAREKGYDLILCKSSGIDNVLYADEAYDVTEQVVAALNKLYAKEQKAAGKSVKAKKEKTAQPAEESAE